MSINSDILAAINALNATLTAVLDDQAPAKAPKAKSAQPAELVAAKTHCYEARMTRRNAAANKANAKGLTKAEKSALYDTRRDELTAMTPAARKAAWTKMVAAYKAAEKA